LGAKALPLSAERHEMLLFMPDQVINRMRKGFKSTYK